MYLGHLTNPLKIGKASMFNWVCLFFPVLVKMPIIFPMLGALAPFPKMVVRALNVYRDNKHILKNRIYGFDQDWTWGNCRGVSFLFIKCDADRSYSS